MYSSSLPGPPSFPSALRTRKAEEKDHTTIKNICLSTVDDDLVLEAHLLVHEEIFDVCSLVSRELQDLAELDVLVDAPVALEGLLQSLGELLDVQVICQALHCGDTLAPISLLHEDVDLAVVATRLLGGKRVSGSLEIVDIHFSLSYVSRVLSKDGDPEILKSRSEIGAVEV